MTTKLIEKVSDKYDKNAIVAAIELKNVVT